VKSHTARAMAALRADLKQQHRAWKAWRPPPRTTCRRSASWSLSLPESVRGITVHGNVIVTAAGLDIADRQPALPPPMR